MSNARKARIAHSTEPRPGRCAVGGRHDLNTKTDSHSIQHVVCMKCGTYLT